MTANQTQPDPSPIQAAHELNCTRQTIYNLLKRGELDCYYIGRHVRILRDSINQFKRGGRK